MSEINLQNSIVNIFGPGTSGKSNFIKWLLTRKPYRRHVVFDPMHEYDADRFNVYRPDAVEYDGGNEELNMFLDRMMALPRGIRPRYIVVDEAANFIPGGNKTVGSAVSRLMYHNTHIHPGITVITANRHPTDLDSTMREMFDHMIVFGARGNAKDALERMAEGLRDAVEGLDPYHFIHVDPMGNLTEYGPVEEMEGYDRI